jgi:hypothetical protein
VKNPSRGTRIALLVAPLSGCLAVFVSQLIWSLVSGSGLGVPTGHPLFALLVWLWIFILFGMPVALIATVAILLPLAPSTGPPRPWWVPTLVGATAGQVLFFAYLHALAPRGSLELAPGAGAIAGATNGVVFWWIALRRRADGDAI